MFSLFNCTKKNVFKDNLFLDFDFCIYIYIYIVGMISQHITKNDFGLIARFN